MCAIRYTAWHHSHFYVSHFLIIYRILEDNNYVYIFFFFFAPKTLEISEVIRPIKVSFVILNKLLSTTPEFMLIEWLQKTPEDGGWLLCNQHHVVRRLELSAPPSSRLGGEFPESELHWELLDLRLASELGADLWEGALNLWDLRYYFKVDSVRTELNFKTHD